MRVSVLSLKLPKSGNQASECEDAFALPKYHNRPRRKFRFAIADGATESAFSGLWAEKLVAAYCNHDSRKSEPMGPAVGFAVSWKRARLNGRRRYGPSRCHGLRKRRPNVARSLRY